MEDIRNLYRALVEKYRVKMKLELHTHRLIFILYLFIFESRSSVSKASAYGLDDREIEVRSPAEAKAFFL
jgi:hypothetical protein